MKCFGLCLLLLLFGLRLDAQAPPAVAPDSVSYTLEGAVRYAVEHLEAIRSQQLSVSIAEYQFQAARRRRLPTVNGSADLRDNLVLPTSILPGAIFRLPEGQSVAVQFGTRYNFTVATDASVDLFSPGRRQTIAASEASKSAAQANLDLQRLGAATAVRRAYYALLLSQEQLNIARENAERARQLWERVKARMEQYQALQLDADRAEVDYQNRLSEVARLQRSVAQNEATLGYQMGFAPGTRVTASDTGLLRALSATNDTTLAPIHRPEALRLFQLEKQARLVLASSRKAYLPTVSAYGYLATQALRQEFNFLSTQQRWYPISYIGVRLSVPIFDGLQRQATIEQNRLLLRQAELNRTAFERQASYEVDLALIALQNALSDIATAERNRRQAEAVLAQANARYSQGQADQQLVVESERSLLDAQNAYLSALYTRALAELDLQHALGYGAP